METIGSYEAKTHLARLLEQVSMGRTVTITKHGVPVARLVPVGAARLQPVAAIATLREARRGVRRGRASIRRMIDEGHR